MESRAKLLGHPIHQMLIVFPLGLLGMAVIFDVIRLVTGSTGLGIASYYMILAGVISGLVAAVFGVIDWTAIPSGTRAKAVGTWHAVGNVIVVLLFAGSWWLRVPDHADPPTLAFVVALAGAGLSLVTAWFGGELVNRHGVGVSDGAHVNAPSSLSQRPAREQAGT